MAYVYKVTNDINDKVYIGKTYHSVEKRWQEHIRESRRKDIGHRPLHKAMNKYGVSHFYVEQLEETNIPEEREKYWIDVFDSFHNGYNATTGGDGKPYLDYDLIVNTYTVLQSEKLTAETLNIDACTVRKILHEKHVQVHNPRIKKVMQFDLDDNFVQLYESALSAGYHMVYKGKSKGNHITAGNRIRECCKKNNGTVYGYKWQYES